MHIRPLFAALLGCLCLGTPGTAETRLSLSVWSGQAKHELQPASGAGLHYSLLSHSGTVSLELTRPDSFQIGAFSIDTGLALSHEALEHAGSDNSPKGWIKDTDTTAHSQSTRAMVTFRTTLHHWGDTRLEGGVGIGLDAARVQITRGDQTGRGAATLPHLQVGLRMVQPLDVNSGPLRDADLWTEVTYRTSPALTVTFDDGSTVLHEVSGLGLAVGVTFALD